MNHSAAIVTPTGLVDCKRMRAKLAPPACIAMQDKGRAECVGCRLGESVRRDHGRAKLVAVAESERSLSELKLREATPAASDTHVCGYECVLSTVRCYARECESAREERARGEQRIADRRMVSADKMLAALRRRVQSAHGAETTRAWFARAEREAGLA